MADENIKQVMRDAILDADSLEKFINGSDSETVLTRLSAEYPTIANALKNLFINGGLPAKPYQKLAHAQSATLDNGQYVYVTNDTQDKNGLYIYATNSGLMRTSSADYLKYAIQMIVEDMPERLGVLSSVNLADVSTGVKGEYYNPANGQIVPAANNNFMALDLVKIKPLISYRFSDNYNQMFSFFDKDKKFISGFVSPPVSKVIESPANSHYIGITVTVFEADTFMFAEASQYPAEYVPHYKHLSGVRVESSDIVDFYHSVKEALGVKTSNIIDLSDDKIVPNKFVNFRDGLLHDIDSRFVALGYYPVEPSTEYRITDGYSQQLAFYNKNKEYVSGWFAGDVVGDIKKFTTPRDAAFIRITGIASSLDSLVVAPSVDFPDSYVPYGISIPNLNIPKEKTTVLTVSPDADSNADFVGSTAIQDAIDSITDASELSKYVIKVRQGTYKANNSSGFTAWEGYPAMVDAKDFVSLEGDGEHSTVIYGALPALDGDIEGELDRTRYQTLWNRAGNLKISNMTFIAENIRYALHQDNHLSKDKTRHYENVSFIFKGNKGLSVAMGIGTFSGEQNYVKGGTSYSDGNYPFLWHNNAKFSKPSKWSFNGHTFIANNSSQGLMIKLSSCGSLLKDNIELIGCKFGGTGYVIWGSDEWLKGNTSTDNDSFDHCEWHLTGHSNSPFLYDASGIKGLSLRITSDTEGDSSKVRFDTESSAYSVLIKNKRPFQPLGALSGRNKYINEYIVKDGSVGLSGEAIGCLDISESKYLLDGSNYTSLGKRLGDCRANSIELGVSVDGQQSTIVFNKDYRAMSNAQILDEINNSLVGATAGSYCYGQEYYPEMTDVISYEFNGTQSSIPKGSAVEIVNGYLHLANGDKVDGIALDDIPVTRRDSSSGVVTGGGRILTKGYIFNDDTKPHYARCSDTSLEVGTKLKAVDGVLQPSSTGSIVIARASDIVYVE